MMIGRVMVLVVCAAALPAELAAQNSIFGVRGIGFPGRGVSVRARALGGAVAVFDHGSAINPGAVGGYTRLRVAAQTGTTYRNYDASSTSVSGLRETRFPMAVIGGGVGLTRLAFAVSFSTYAERSFDITLADTVDVNGEPLGVTDRLAADGGVVDMRFALGWRASTAFHVGGALHLLNGSTRVTARREFPDTDFSEFNQVASISFRGIGASGGVNWRSPRGTVQIAGVGRFDHRLRSAIGDQESSDIDAPASVHGGVQLTLSPRVAWSVAGGWKGWSVADGDLAGTDSRAFDTWEAASGLELTRAVIGMPLRLGGRYATLPFGPTANQPSEYSLSIGTGRSFAAGRGILDVSVERLFRDGAAVTERGWYVAVGLTVQP